MDIKQFLLLARHKRDHAAQLRYIVAADISGIHGVNYDRIPGHNGKHSSIEEITAEKKEEAAARLPAAIKEDDRYYFLCCALEDFYYDHVCDRAFHTPFYEAILYYARGVPVNDIAAKTGRPPAVIRKRISRAIISMNKALSPEQLEALAAGALTIKQGRITPVEISTSDGAAGA